MDNTGTGGPAGNTGANLNIPLDANIATVASTTTNLDTNGTGNAFTLNRDVTGTGTLNLTGGGNINLSTGGTQVISANIAGTAPIVKLGTGTTTLQGGGSGYTGNVTISSGTPPRSCGSRLWNSHRGGRGRPGRRTRVSKHPHARCHHWQHNLLQPEHRRSTNHQFSGAQWGKSYRSHERPHRSGALHRAQLQQPNRTGTLSAANPGNYRVAPTVTDTGTSFTLDITGRKDLTWTGAASTAWNINSAINWNDTTPTADKFYTLDNVTFPEGAANTNIALTGLLAPSSIAVTSSTTPYTFTSTAGNQITGGTGITKTGGSTLTLTGPNLYNGPTSMGGGEVVINGSTSLGSGISGNSLAISGGARLSYTTGAAWIWARIVTSHWALAAAPFLITMPPEPQSQSLETLLEAERITFPSQPGCWQRLLHSQRRQLRLHR